MPPRSARQILRNARTILGHSGSAPSLVLKETVYLTNIDGRYATRVERAEFYGEHLPASTLSQVAAMTHLRMLVEMDFVAVVGNIARSR